MLGVCAHTLEFRGGRIDLMAKSQVLADIKSDIQAGNLGLARDRLHSLVDTFPQDLALRKQLGEVYHRLQYPERAGCYWFLVEKKTPEMESACAEFVRAAGGDPHQMLRSIKLRGGPANLSQGYARTVLEDLAARAPDYRFPVPKIPQIRKNRQSDSTGLADSILKSGCLLALVATIAIFVWGVYSLWMLTQGYRLMR